MHIKTEDFYKDVNNDVDKQFDTSNYDKNDNRPLEIGKNKKVIGKFKDVLGGKIMTEFCALRAKTYSSLIDDYSDDDYKKNKIINKKAQGTKKSVIKRELMFKNYKDSLFNDEVIIRSQQQRSRSGHHRVYIEEINKIALSSNDDKRIQTFKKVTTFSYGTNMFKVCENEMLLKRIKHKHSVEEKEEMNMPIAISNRTDNDLLAKYDDDDDDDCDDFDLDDEWKKSTGCHRDIDTEDEMMEDKIDDGEVKDVIDKIDDETDNKIEDMIE